MIRSQLEYASAAFISASKTQLKKLDTVQKKASRIICRVPRDSHAEPLLALLKLDPLETRRNAHATKTIEQIITGNSHPALSNWFTLNLNGTVTNTSTARINIGKRRFSIAARDIYNSQCIKAKTKTS